MGNTRFNTYFYYRNGLLHIRHMVDEAVELSDYEAEKLKERLTASPFDKQGVLRAEWDFQTKTLGKKKFHGIMKAKENTDRLSAKYGKSEAGNEKTSLWND